MKIIRSSKGMKPKIGRNIYILLICTVVFLFSGCVNQQQKGTTTTTEVIQETTTTIEITIQETTTIATTTTVLSDCNEICSDLGYSKTLGVMNAVDCDKNTPVGSSKKWKFNCCCYSDNTSCYDSDDGLNVNVKGEVVLSSGRRDTDFCYNDTVLVEQICSFGTVTAKPVDCLNGCKDGACLLSE